MPAPQIYALPDLWNELKPAEQERYRIRALATLHPDWVFANVSAAAVHGLAVTNSLFGHIHLACRRRGNTRSRAGIVRHIVTNDSLEVVNGIKVTSLARTAFDCMLSCNFRAGLAIADSTLRVSGKTRDELIDGLNKLRNAKKQGWRAIETAQYADGRAENGGESVIRAIIIEQGFLVPNLQVEVSDPINPKSTFRVDFCWDLPSGRVIGELDGKEKYRNPTMTKGRDVVDVLTDERLRESRITCSDAKVMRFSYGEAMNTKWFCQLLKSFGIPSGFAIPRVALI